MSKERLLVIGGGGREHALAWKLGLDANVEQVFLAPGNPGMEGDAKLVCTGLAAGDFAGIAAFAKANGVSFVVVGPDQALADGAVDFLEGQGIPSFGPTREASRIEWSKAFSKGLMAAAGIATARYEVFSGAADARAFLESVEWGSGWVVKADGLALGKGVAVCEQRSEALAFCAELFSGSMGSAGKQVVIEERLAGREVSAFFLCDGTHAVPLGMACDYKRIFDGDLGPNTGGMGAFTPADWLPGGFLEGVGREVSAPLLAEMQKRGCAFQGVLFVGLMVHNGIGKVLEFNARFGDPETQALLPLLDEELLPWLRAARNGQLASMPPAGPKHKAGAAVHVVSAAEGYPGTPRKGDVVSVAPDFLTSWSAAGVKLFYAGVSLEAGALAVSGGRVFGVTALGATREQAREKAYTFTEQARFAGRQRRGDVGL